MLQGVSIGISAGSGSFVSATFTDTLLPCRSTATHDSLLISAIADCSHTHSSKDFLLQPGIRPFFSITAHICVSVTSLFPIMSILHTNCDSRTITAQQHNAPVTSPHLFLNGKSLNIKPCLSVTLSRIPCFLAILAVLR